MSDFEYRVRILDCLLDGRGSFELKLNEKNSKGKHTLFIAKLGASYSIDYHVSECLDEVDSFEVFFEVLKNGNLLSGAKSPPMGEYPREVPELNDFGLDHVLNRALMTLAH